MKPALLHLFTGSGGVGKTTLSSAWALALAQQGQRVALITIDPAKRLAQSLGLDALNDTLSATNVHPLLWAMMLDQSATSQRLVETYATDRESATKILTNRYYQVFSRSLAGVQEMMAIHEVHEALYSGRYDAVVLDTPPAQHALDLLDVPERLRVALDGPALKWLIEERIDVKKRRGLRASLSDLSRAVALKAFTKITAGPFLEDLLQFIELFSGVLTKIKSNGLTLESALKSEHSKLWVVTSTDASPLRAAARVTEELAERGYEVSGWLVNRTPSLLCGPSPSPLNETLERATELIRVTLNEHTELSALASSVAHQEVERAHDARRSLDQYKWRSGLHLISEISPDHEPLSMVRELARYLNSLHLIQS